MNPDLTYKTKSLKLYKLSYEKLRTSRDEGAIALYGRPGGDVMSKHSERYAKIVMYKNYPIQEGLGLFFLAEK